MDKIDLEIKIHKLQDHFMVDIGEQFYGPKIKLSKLQIAMIKIKYFFITMRVKLAYFIAGDNL